MQLAQEAVMFDVLADLPDNSATAWVDTAAATAAATTVQRLHSEPTTFRTISVLLIETRGTADSFPITEQCLRYMSRFECQITGAGSRPAAAFALSQGKFDVVIADQHSLDLIAGSIAPVIVVADHMNGDTTRKSRSAGAMHCLALDDLSPRLLETAISQMLRGEPGMT
jgi:hypothetical protein